MKQLKLARRHTLIRLGVGMATVAAGAHASTIWALSLADLTEKDAGAGVKSALEKGAQVAVDLLGRQDGFWANDRVRIHLPDWLEKGEKMLRLIGRGHELDDLKLGINRAAEQAVPQARQLLVTAIRGMTLQDAKSLLSGGDQAVTQFFRDKTHDPLGQKFLPIVKKVTDRSGLARQYNQLADQVQGSGLVKLKPEQARVETHVTAKALDGLYYMIGEEEKKIRQDPVGTGSDLLRRVFGALR
jgi:hypothetical protein